MLTLYPKPAYILCTESPCTQRTPKIYEMDSKDICPACGEVVKYNYVKGHIMSEYPKSLMIEKAQILSDRVLKWRHK